MPVTTIDGTGPQRKRNDGEPRWVPADRYIPHSILAQADAGQPVTFNPRYGHPNCEHDTGKPTDINGLWDGMIAIRLLRRLDSAEAKLNCLIHRPGGFELVIDISGPEMRPGYGGEKYPAHRSGCHCFSWIPPEPGSNCDWHSVRLFVAVAGNGLELPASPGRDL